jgi:hypothetical protein
MGGKLNGFYLMMLRDDWGCVVVGGGKSYLSEGGEWGMMLCVCCRGKWGKIRKKVVDCCIVMLNRKWMWGEYCGNWWLGY